MKTVKISKVTESTEEILAEGVEVADNPLTRLRGLMGRTGLPDNGGLWLQPCNSIHSFFMRFSFDAVLVDKAGTVVGLIENMQPWRVSKLYKQARATLELPAGTIAKRQLKLGDSLKRG